MPHFREIFGVSLSRRDDLKIAQQFTAGEEWQVTGQSRRDG